MTTGYTLLAQAASAGASDIHLYPGAPPSFRVYGKLVRPTDEPLSDTDIELFLHDLAPADLKDRVHGTSGLDFSTTVRNVGRLRVNVFQASEKPAVAIRRITVESLEFQALGLPEILRTFCTLPRGLVLVTGATGCGKSTTLAAMLDHINETQERHIITLEDPIEYLHPHKRSLVNQREIGRDVATFAAGIQTALRQDPDVVFVGEMRTLDTIRATLQAADTGHLVMATVHSNDAPSTVERIVSVFPAEEQNQVRVQLAANIQAIVTQRLFSRTDTPGLVPALEIMTATQAIRNLIHEGKGRQIPSAMQTGGGAGMKLMEDAAYELFTKKTINWAEFQAAFPEAAARRRLSHVQ